MKYLLFFFFFLAPLTQAADSEQETISEQNKVIESTLSTLQNLIQLTKEKNVNVNKAIKDLKKQGQEIEQEKSVMTLTEMEADLELLKYKLESIATTVSVKEYRNREPEKFDLQKELESLLQPMLYSLKSITQDSRLIENYRQSIEKIDNKQKETDLAVAHLNKLLSFVENKKSSTNPELKNLLTTLLSTWQEEQKLLINEHSTLNNQLQNILNSNEPLLESTGEVFSGFFKSRGINILLGTAAFFGVFVLMRYLYSLKKKIKQRPEHIKSSFERLFNLVFLGASFALSFLATLFVFNLRHDWLLLGLGCLFLLALIWMVIKSLPTMLDQCMLLLNLGSIREGERLIYNGIPWEVKSLNYYTHFVNPDLSGGSLHISVKELMGMVSRPIAPNEEWFPSKENDWVQLEDENIGRVVYQSPEMVQLALFGGSFITYSTESYLAQNPKNLSKNYRIQMVFGIDYQYQSLCTSEIQEKMCQRLKNELEELLGKDQLINVTTDFFSPNSSSLDYEYEAYVKGSSAHMYEEVERVMVKSFADTCNTYNWVIPFQQITLHKSL